MVLATALLAALLQTIWAFFLATNGGDMAAQYAWQHFTATDPDAAYNLSWYGGVHPASYSLLTPYLMAWLGVRTTAVVAGTLSAAVFARLLRLSGLRRRAVPSLCGAVALSCDTFSGRVTFSVGILFALLALTVLREGFSGPMTRCCAAGALGLVATAASPVAGLFLLVAAAAYLLERHVAPGVALAVGPPLVIGATTVLFPFYGIEPFTLSSAMPAIVTAFLLAVCAAPSWRTVRVAAGVYVLAVVLALVIPSPVGSNVLRLPLLFAAPLLLAASRAVVGLRAWALRLGLLVALVWQVMIPVGDVSATEPASGWSQYARPLVTELNSLHAYRGRVEAVPARSHWESAGLAGDVELARGWNRQVDVERNPVFYKSSLSAAAYRAWLNKWSVGYVVLPMAPLDVGAVTEGRVVRSGPNWLRMVWRNAHWRLYQVRDAPPLASGPARVMRAGADDITLRMARPGSTVVKIEWSSWLSATPPVTGTQECLSPSGQWTQLTVDRAGIYKVGASYLRGPGRPCGT